jgi:hypothetical protein
MIISGGSDQDRSGIQVCQWAEVAGWRLAAAAPTAATIGCTAVERSPSLGRRPRCLERTYQGPGRSHRLSSHRIRAARGTRRMLTPPAPIYSCGGACSSAPSSSWSRTPRGSSAGFEQRCDNRWKNSATRTAKTPTVTDLKCKPACILGKWCPGAGSNHRHCDFQRGSGRIKSTT